MRGPSATATLASGNDPVQRMDVRGQVHRTKERLAAEEPITTRNIQEVPNASVGIVLALDRGSQPNVGGHALVPGRKSPSKMRPLGQQQPVEVGRALYERPEPFTQAVETAVPLEDIRHRRAEHARARRPGLGGVAVPTKRLTPIVVAQLSARSSYAPHAVACTSRPDLGVAVIARRRDLRATPPRVERVARPFNGGISCHATDWTRRTRQPERRRQEFGQRSRRAA